MNSRILPILALMLSVGAFFAYIQPNWSGSIAETKAAIQSDKDALNAAAKYKATQNALASARSAIDPANLDRLSVFLPDSVDNVRLILDINALAARSGLSLSNIDAKKNDTKSPSATASTGARPVTAGATTATPAASAGSPTASVGQSSRNLDLTGSVDLTLTAVGSYNALKTFLTSIEKSARLLDVSDLAVKSSETGVYTYQMTIRLYWLK